MILIIDTETTGTGPTDQIVELCMQRGLDGASEVWRFKPTIPIPAAASAIHGINDADVADCGSFAEFADGIALTLSLATVIVGYNLSFDVGMLTAEFARLGRTLDLSHAHHVDPLELWRRREPRGLQQAHRRFVGEEFTGAHGAAADCAATGRVLLGMLAAYGLTEDWPAIAHECNPERATWVGPSNHLRWVDGRIVVSFGKHAGTPLTALDPGYRRWLLGADFPAHVREIVANGEAWAAERYGRRAA